MNTVIETITVEKAQEYLNTSKGNRPMSKKVIHSYAEQMKQGKWMLNGVSIVFDVDGCLIDGHHRLHAVCYAGIPVKMSVCRGVEPDAFATFDCGRQRTIGQTLALKSVKNYNAVGSIIAANQSLCRIGRILENNSQEKGTKRTNAESYKLYLTDACGYDEAAEFAVRLRNSVNMLNVSCIGSLYYFLTHTGGYDKETVTMFFEELCSLKESSFLTIELLRKRIIGDRMRGIKLEHNILFALVVKAWNAFVSGRDVKTLKFDPDVEYYPKLILKK